MVSPLADELRAKLPTPLLQLSRADGRPALWCKNDGLTGIRYGGNKLRKLAALLELAASRGVERLVTVGAAGSHHVLATTLYGRAQGLEVLGLFAPQPHTPHAERVFRCCIAAGVEPVPLKSQAALILSARACASGRDLFIAPGGMGPTGSAPYADAFVELADQVSAGAGPKPDRIVVALGSGSTAAGLLAGLAERGEWADTQLVGVLTSRNPAARSMVVAQARAVARRRGARVSWAELNRRLHLLGDYVGEGYGHPSSAGDEATRIAAADGLLLDPTYTAKSFAAALDLCRTEGGSTLYWHTLSAVPLEPLLAGAPRLDELALPLRRLLLPNPDLNSRPSPRAR